VHGLDAITGVGEAEGVRSVVVLGYRGVQALDVVGPCDVFTAATGVLRGQGREDGYAVSVVSRGGAPIATGTGLELAARPLPDPRRPVDTLVLPGGFGVDEARSDPELIGWLRLAAEHARRTVSVCTGAFLAAQAGLVDGCAVTTHWAFADRLAAEFPSVTVDPDPIFVRSSDRVWTAAGVTAGIDLALALVEDDVGTDVAQTIARWLVMYLRRPGGQTQFAAPQLRSPTGYLARSVPQDLRLTAEEYPCRSRSCSTRASPRWTSSAPTTCCATCPAPRCGSSGTNPARSPPTPGCCWSAPPTRSTRPRHRTSCWCRAG